MSVLVLAQIELIFFTVASMGLCFWFVPKPVLITQGCFSYRWAVLTQSQGLFCFSPHSTNKRAGGAQGIGGDTAGTADPNWPKGYSVPYDVMLSIQSWRNVGRVGHCLGTGWASVIWLWAIVLVCITCLSWVLFLSLCYFPFHYNFLLIILFYFHY